MLRVGKRCSSLKIFRLSCENICRLAILTRLQADFNAAARTVAGVTYWGRWGRASGVMAWHKDVEASLSWPNTTVRKLGDNPFASVAAKSQCIP